MSSDFCIRCDNALSVYCGQCVDAIRKELDELRKVHAEDRASWDETSERMEEMMRGLIKSRDEAQGEAMRLRSYLCVLPELPPRPPHGDGVPRYGIRWNGPTQPISVPMADGYWTPWHLADSEVNEARGAFLAAAQAIGIVYEAEGHAPAPGPVETVVEAIRDAARAKGRLIEVEMKLEQLQWGNEMACENTPHPACECAGCSLARDRARRGVAGPEDE